MYLILNTVKFQKDQNHNTPNYYNANECTRSVCETLKEILNHMIDDFQNESSNCCQHYGQQQQQQAGTENSSGYATLESSSSSSTMNDQNSELQASMVSSTKGWHNTITHELRNHLVDKLIQAILPTSDQSTTFDEQMHNFITYAQKTEEDIYEMADSKTEYYYLLANKIYEIQNGLKERRQKRLAERSQMVKNQSAMTTASQIITDSDTEHDTNQQNSQVQQQTYMASQQQVRDFFEIIVIPYSIFACRIANYG